MTFDIRTKEMGKFVCLTVCLLAYWVQSSSLHREIGDCYYMVRSESSLLSDMEKVGTLGKA